MKNPVRCFAKLGMTNMLGMTNKVSMKSMLGMTEKNRYNNGNRARLPLTEKGGAACLILEVISLILYNCRKNLQNR